MAGIGPTLHRVPALDGLRAIAVTGVLLFHGGVTAVPGGFLGVDVFFVLSGYLITSLLLAERAAAGRISLPHFWMRRARRLLPAVVALVVTVVIVSTLFLASSEAGRVRGDALSSLLYVNNWHQIFTEQSYFEAVGRPSLLRHLWSLSVEEQFYLLWPLALIAGLNAVRRLRFVQVVLGAAAVSTLLMAILYDPSSDPSRVYYGTDTRLTPLLLGATLAFLWPMRSTRGSAGPRAAALLDAAAVAGLVAVGVAFATAHEYDTWIYRGGLAAIAAATALLIAAVVHPACRVARPLASRPFVWVGERSYGIYLWHWPVMVLSRPGIDVSLTLWVLVPLQIAITVGLAAASYRWIERPFRTGEAQARIREWMGRRRPRQRLGVVAGVVLATVFSGVWLASGSAGSQKPRVTNTPQATVAPARSRPAAPTGKQDPPLLVGASVMLGAQDALQQRLGQKILIDAAVGRNPDDIAARLEAYKQSNALPNRVVVQAGENAPLREEDINRIHDALRGVPRVVFVNVHVPNTTWGDDVNNTLLALRGEWPQMVIADWNKAARRDLLYSDGIHPTPEGAKVYARVIQQALRAPAAG